MSTKETGGNAFPYIERSWSTVIDQWELGESVPGMTLRDYFAAKALVGLMTSRDMPGCHTVKDDAEYCYMISDAMLTARKS